MKRSYWLCFWVLFLVFFLSGCSGDSGLPTITTSPEGSALVQSVEPSDGSESVPVSSVVRVRFTRPLEPGEIPGLMLRRVTVPYRLYLPDVPARQVLLADRETVILYPVEDLAPASDYEVWLAETALSSSGGPEVVLKRLAGFRTCPSVQSGTVVDFDPLDPGRLTPYPCDIFCEPDAGTVTGLRRSISDDVRPFTIRPGELERADGFGTFPRFAVPLTGPLHGRFLSPDPAATEDPAGPLFLANVDPDSMGCGERVPLLVEEDPFGLALSKSEHGLTLFPARPLEPETTYALVITRRLTGPDGGPVEPSEAFRRVLAGDEDPALEKSREVIGPVLDYLQSPGFEVPLSAKDLALVLPFTTRSKENLTGDLIAIRDFLARTSPQDPPEVVVTYSSAEPSRQGMSHEYVGRYVEGTVESRDFRGEDGLFDTDLIHYRPGEAPLVALEFIMTLPRGASAETPVPVLIFLHGINDRKETMYSFADALARKGIAAIAIDTVEHGSRQTRPELDAWIKFLSIEDIARGRDNMRQTHADLLTLTRAVQLSLPAALGGPILETDRFVFAGFSLGGILGTGFLSLEPSIQGAALFGMGGPFTEIAARNSILEPGGPVFLLLVNLLGVLPGSTMELLGALLCLNQEILDPGDPISYAPYVNGRALTGTDGMKDLLLLEAMDDTTMANRTTENMARAFGMEIVQPVLWDVPGLNSIPGPLTGNGPNGKTAGLVQFDVITKGGEKEPAEHGNIFSGEEPQAVAAHFLATCLESGQGEIQSAYPDRTGP
jgi:dienelactone hydrolase